ncbi:unnamed protein product, partial [Choristocarpus tenellus]
MEGNDTSGKPDFCSACEGTGDLLVCAGSCGMAYHDACAGTSNENAGEDWRCELCVGEEVNLKGTEKDLRTGGTAPVPSQANAAPSPVELTLGEGRTNGQNIVNAALAPAGADGTAAVAAEFDSTTTNRSSISISQDCGAGDVPAVHQVTPSNEGKGNSVNADDVTRTSQVPATSTGSKGEEGFASYSKSKEVQSGFVTSAKPTSSEDRQGERLVNDSVPPQDNIEEKVHQKEEGIREGDTAGGEGSTSASIAVPEGRAEVVSIVGKGLEKDCITRVAGTIQENDDAEQGAKDVLSAKGDAQQGAGLSKGDVEASSVMLTEKSISNFEGAEEGENVVGEGEVTKDEIEADVAQEDCEKVDGEVSAMEVEKEAAQGNALSQKVEPMLDEEVGEDEEDKISRDNTSAATTTSVPASASEQDGAAGGSNVHVTASTENQDSTEKRESLDSSVTAPSLQEGLLTDKDTDPVAGSQAPTCSADPVKTNQDSGASGTEGCVNEVSAGEAAEAPEPSTTVDPAPESVEGATGQPGSTPEAKEDPSTATDMSTAPGVSVTTEKALAVAETTAKDSSGMETVESKDRVLLTGESASAGEPVGVEVTVSSTIDLSGKVGESVAETPSTAADPAQSMGIPPAENSVHVKTTGRVSAAQGVASAEGAASKDAGAGSTVKGASKKGEGSSVSSKDVVSKGGVGGKSDGPKAVLKAKVKAGAKVTPAKAGTGTKVGAKISKETPLKAGVGKAGGGKARPVMMSSSNGGKSVSTSQKVGRSVSRTAAEEKQGKTNPRRESGGRGGTGRGGGRMDRGRGRGRGPE